jgi:hypothetical protein
LDFGRRYFGGKLEKLIHMKRHYDPDDLFAFSSVSFFASPQVWEAETV